MIGFALAPQALRVLRSIESYRGSRDLGLCLSLTLALEEALLFLVDKPAAGSPFERSRSRKWRIGRAPYLLFHTVKGEILPVARVRQNNENWRKPH